MTRKPRKLSEYLIKTERLGLRNWKESDIDPMTKYLNQDPVVMEFFPYLKTKPETAKFVERMQVHCTEHGFCYFAVDRLDQDEFIGFIGLMHQTYESDYTPCVDIGWRLKTAAWGQGFATEGAKACLDFAFKKANLEEIYSIASVGNVNSENVMKKIGMQKVKEMDFVKLLNFPELKRCVLYKQTKDKHESLSL